MKQVFLLSTVLSYAAGDCYMHNPRGSNNRLNEQSANRNNGNRLFDSQNNNRGGYNKGDFDDTAAQDNTGAACTQPPNAPFPNECMKGQYSEVFYEGSTLPVEYTVQHGCGGNEKGDVHKLNCNMVIQYMCNTNNKIDEFEKVEMMDGRNTNQPNDADSFADITTTNTDNNNNRRGRHESEGWYYQCEHRHRNKGLFTADQNLKGDAAKYTRQNPNGNRRGLECPEERDYYPYWHPTPWTDVAYLTDVAEDCTNVLANSNNAKAVGKCTRPTTVTDENEIKAILKAADSDTCTAANGVWKEFVHNTALPVCKQGGWSRVNHLGNGRHGQPLNYNWTLPKLDTMSQYYAKSTVGGANLAKCVLRVRYNISTDDYDPRTTDASKNNKPGEPSPVVNNPTVDTGLPNLQGLKLAINTNQFGRTFQDRSHTFYVKAINQGTGAKTMRNLNVRGKRGNIVQTFPSVEYDFVPNYLHVKPGENIHLQWTGSNTHNNGNPAGDGQAGDAGEGTGGTDRHNIAELVDRGTNYPVPYEKAPPAEVWSDLNSNFKRLFDNFYCKVPKVSAQKTTDEYNPDYWKDNDWVELPAEECAVYLASSGFFKKSPTTTDTALNPTLNNAPASLHGGVILSPKAAAAGEYHYMGTRNNNFSNRSQKGTIIVTSETVGHGNVI